jgi:hypothetical protein
MAASVDVFTLIESIAMESSLPPTPVSRLKTYPFGGETTVQFIIVSLDGRYSSRLLCTNGHQEYTFLDGG